MLQAAQAIFSVRNSEASVFSSRRLDLHGLHAAEAIECLHALLPEIHLRHSRGGRCVVDVSVVTGSGHHSAARGTTEHSRVYTAAVAVCAELGIEYTPIKDPRGYTGGFVAHLSGDALENN